MKIPTFSSVEIGESFGPIHVDINDQFIKSYAFSVDDYAPFYFASEPSQRLAPSMCLAKKLVHIFMTVYDPNALVALHQHEDVVFHKRVAFGSRVTLTGKYIDKYVRRGKGYVVLEGEARDEQGHLLVTQRSTEILDIPDEHTESDSGVSSPKRRISGVWPEDRAIRTSLTGEVRVNDPLPVLVKTTHQDQMSVFCGAEGGWRNIHTDVAVARRANADNTVVPGMMIACWFSEMMAQFSGVRMFDQGALSASFLKRVECGQTLTCRGVVSGLREIEGQLAAEVEFWAENANGEVVAVAWAWSHAALNAES